MKINEKVIRKYVINAIICLLLIGIASFTYIGGVTNVFGNATYTAYYCGNKNSKNISLMFNVYQNTEIVEKILQILQENNVKATFFVGGSWAVNNNECLTKICESGNEIGNHGYWHKDHKNLSIEKNYSEMNLTHKVVKEITGYEISLFAPPSGSFGQNTLKVAQNMGYKTIMWTIDTIDWRDQDENLIYKRATKNASGGNFILMHPTFCTESALPRIISYYKNLNYKLTTVSENIC